MTFRTALALLLTSWGLHAHPGDPLGSFRPVFAAPAPATGACVDAAGRLCLFGGFASVDGVETGGIVRLAADGAVEAILAETLVAPPFAAGSLAFWLPFPGADPQSVGMLALSAGRILLSAPRAGHAVVSPDGGVGSGFLQGIGTGIEVFPQFEHGGFLIVIVRHADGSRRLARQAIAAESWAPEFLEWNAGWLPPFAAVRGPGGTIRVLGVRPKPLQTSYQIQPFLEQAVFLIDQDGVPTGGDPLILADDRPATLHATDDDGGYRLHFGAAVHGVAMWPGSQTAHTLIEWRDNANELLRTRNFASPLGLPFVIAEEAGGALLATAPDGQLMRYLADGDPDPGFAALPPVGHILPLPDGGFLLDGTRKILAGGEADPDWQAPLLEKPGTVSNMLVGHGGRVFVAGDFHRAGAGGASHLAVLDAAGDTSAGFVPGLPGPVRDMAATADGRLLVVCSQPLTSPDGAANLLRLHEDGRHDASFDIGFPAGLRIGGNADTVTAMPDGRILVTVFERSPALATASLEALLPDGSPDPDFLRVTGYHSPLPKPLVLPDGTFFLGSIRHAGNGSVLSSVASGNLRHSHRPLCRMPDGAVIFVESSWPAPRLLRWKNGAWDPGFTAEIADVAGAHPAAHGKLIVWGSSFGVARLHRNGRIDATFRAPVLENHLRRGPADWQTLGAGGIVPLGQAGRLPGTVVSAIHHPSTGDLWIGGSFNRVGDEPRDSIAALDASNPIGFAGWTSATLRDAPGHQAPDADPDGDGIPNWLEYATGGDPLRPDPRRASLQPVPGDPGTFTISRNPEAPEVIALVEVSDDLADWRIADGSEIVIHSAGPQLTFTLLPAAGPRFTRVRFTDFNQFLP